MGDRATIQLVNGDEFSPIIYLHWAGSRAFDLIQQAAPIMRAGDISYAFARLAGVCHMETGPDQGLSFGIFNAEGPEDPDVGDNGHFTLNMDDGQVWNGRELVGTVELGRF